VDAQQRVEIRKKALIQFEPAGREEDGAGLEKRGV
jgi:hypothetical protein